MFHKVLSRLLDYPDEQLIQALPELHREIRRGLEAAEWVVINRFLGHLESLSLTDAQAAYVLTFDLTAEHSLHLTHHLFGDDKNRGPALIDLSEYYKGFGLEMAANDETGNAGSNEIPDYLPLMLEFAGQLDFDEARVFLSQWSKVLGQLGANLEEAVSPYAPLVRLVEARSLLVRAAA